MQPRTFSALRANAVRQATVTVYVGDSGSELATGLTTVDGTPLDNPFQLPSSGRVTFKAPDGNYRVRLQGPGFDVTEYAQFLDAQTVIDWQENLEAALDAAIAAGESAQSAAASAEIAQNYPASVADARIEAAGISGGINEDYIVAIRDIIGRLTWLCARRSDGLPPEWVTGAIASRYQAENLMPETLLTYLDILWGVCDKNGVLGWNAVGLDGLPLPWAIEMLKDKLGIKNLNTDGLIYTTDRFLSTNGDVSRVIPNMGRIVGVGSSTMAGLASYMTSLAGQFGTSYLDMAKAGERIQATMARFGSRPMLLTFPGNEIPASGSVAVTSSNVDLNANLANLKPYTGTINGVFGTITATASQITFTRSAPGNAVPVDPNTPFIPTLAADCQDSVVLQFGNGKNDFSPSIPGREAQVIELTNGGFDWLSPLVKRSIIGGHFADTNTPENSLERTQILIANEAFAKRYGDLYIDVYGYVTSSQLWEDTGIEPTETDLSQQAIGNKPPSISADNAHFNAAGYSALLNFLIKPKFLELGWYTVI